MTQCNYYLVNPNNNKTVLVESRFDAEVQPFVAKKLLSLEKSAEQVGFICGEKSESFDIKIRMSGGEFCGNACMAAAVVFLEKSKNFKELVRVSMSGCEYPVEVKIIKKEPCGCLCRVNMPKALSVCNFTVSINGKKCVLPIVHYKGISHILINERLEKRQAEALIKNICNSLKADALGLMFIDKDCTHLTPLVYVPAADTLYWENSCASGTAALGEYLLSKNAEVLPITVIQPGGKLKIINDGGICLEGKCKIEKYISENEKLNSVEF